MGPAEHDPTAVAQNEQTKTRKIEFSGEEATEGILEAAKKGGKFRFNEAGNIELVPLHIQNFSAYDLGPNRLAATVDYTLLIEDENEVVLRAVVLRGNQVIQTIRSTPVTLHRGLGSARFKLELRSSFAAQSDKIGFIMSRKIEQAHFYRKIFAHEKRWRPSSPQPKERPAARFDKDKVDIVAFRKIADNEAEIVVAYRRKREQGNEVLKAELFNGETRQKGFSFEEKKLRGKSGFVTAHMTWQGYLSQTKYDICLPFFLLQNSGDRIYLLIKRAS